MFPRSISLAFWCVYVGIASVTVLADPRFAHPELQSFREEYQARLRAMEERHHQALAQHLEGLRPAAEERVRAANLTRNARQIMIARDGRAFLDELIEQVRENPRAEWPADYRPEIREWVEEWRASVDALQERQAHERKAFEERAINFFARAWGEHTREQIPADQRRSMFETFVAQDPAPEPLPEVRPEPAEEAAVEFVEPEKVDPYFARSVADAAPEWVWVPVGEWKGTMHGVDVVRVRVLEQMRPVSSQQLNIHTRREATLQYTPFAVLPERADYRYRLKSVEGRKGVDVLEWPTARNEWHLIFRTPRGDRAQQQVGFVVEVALPGLDLAAALEQSGRMLDDAQVKDRDEFEVTIESQPSLARIYLNGRPYIGPRGPVATPYTVRIPAGPHEIRLRQRYYEDWVKSNFVARAGARINAEMELREDLPWKEMDFSPRRDWQDSGIVLQAGDTFFIEAEGRWQIGARREFTGPEGYDRETFPHYYEDPGIRLTPRAPYGALLIRMGYRAETNLFSEAHGYTHRHGFGISVFLDVNEARSPELRRTNRGALTVRTAVVNPRMFSD